MNLRVDLILESEQRSGSVLSPKSLMRIGSVVGPVALAFLVAAFVFQLWLLGGKLSSLEGQWAALEPRAKKADELRAQLAASRKILGEIEGWRKAHMDWHAELQGLIDIVPENIQLKQMRISQAFEVSAKKVPARAFVAVVDGRAVGDGAEDAVRTLRMRLTSEMPFATNVAPDGVSVVAYGADPTPGAGKNDRVFSVQCRYRPREFRVEAAGK
ncbi:MAG: hypothetical protein FJ225_10555 [Lentisphaerae bacterium]|nr:hypothetical protein [Lentisphaerota bacterium]